MPEENNNNEKLILYGVGLIIAWPLIQGIFSFFKTAGGILALPGDLARALQEAGSGVVEDQVYDQVYSIVSKYTYHPGEARANYIMEFLQESNIKNKNYLIDLFKQQKNEGVNSLVRGAVMAQVQNEVNRILKGWI